MNRSISIVSLSLLFFLSGISLKGQTSISIEHLTNTYAAKGVNVEFKYKTGMNTVGYQFKVFNHLHAKPMLGGGIYPAVFNVNGTSEVSDKFILLYGIDARYDILGVLLEEKTRIKAMPFVSVLGTYMNDKRLEKALVPISVYAGMGIDFRLIKGFGLTSSYRYNFYEKVTRKHVFQLGVNYEF